MWELQAVILIVHQAVAVRLSSGVGAVSTYENLDFQGKQGNDLENPLFYLYRKKAV